MNRIALYIGLALITVCSVIWVTHRDKKIADTTLQPGVAEKIIINPPKRTLVIVTKKNTKVTTLPSRPSSIDIYENGKVKVNAPQWGWEVNPFIAIGWSNQLNDYIGVDVFYWKKLDLGVAVAFDRDLKVKNFNMPVMASYTVWRSVRLSLGYCFLGKDRLFHGAVSVRI